MSLLLTAATVVTMDPQRRILDDGAVLVDGDRIAEVGSTADLRARHRDADELDCTDRVVIPGLVNTHTHLFQTLLKGLGDDMVLKDWFACMTGPSAVHLTPEICSAAALHGCLEAVRSGTTTLVDFMYAHPTAGLTAAVIDAYRTVGMRGVVGRGYLTAGVEYGVPQALIEDAGAALDDARSLIGQTNVAGSRVQVGLAPCMIWSVDEPTIRQSRELADDTGALVTVHVAETPFEIDTSLERFGMRDVEAFDAWGLLGPDVLAVHCVHCSDRDIRILRARDVRVSHNPVSNLYLASGFAPIPTMLLAGLAVGLASDGPASNNNHNMIHVLKFAALTHKGRTGDATVLTAERVLEMATIDGARAIGMDDEIGSVEAGKRADLVVLRYDNLFVQPAHHPVSSLVYAALGNEPETVIIDGQVVMRDRRIQTVAEEDVVSSAVAAARDLSARAGTDRFARERGWRSVAF